MKLKFDLDPKKNKVILIGVLLFLETLLGNVLVILQSGSLPTPIQGLTILSVASLSLVTYFLAFLRKEQEKES